MFQTQEILELLQSIPKGYLEPHHPFFTEHNLNLFQTYKKLGAITNKEDETSNESNCDIKNQIFCNAFGCNRSFDTTAAYHVHYNAKHRFICGECKKSFPTEHFLDMHISEIHDSYFMARVDRGERLFKCYLQDCQDMFGNPQERKDHCLKQHNFPSNFRFDQTRSKKQNVSKNKAKEHKMEVDGEFNSTSSKDLKFEISFGKQTAKGFCSRNEGEKKNDGTTLNMNTLNKVLNTL